MIKAIAASFLVLVAVTTYNNVHRDYKFYNTEILDIIKEEAIMTLGVSEIIYKGGKMFEVSGFGKTCIVDGIGLMNHPDQKDTLILDDKSFNKIEQCFNDL